MDVTVYWN